MLRRGLELDAVGLEARRERAQPVVGDRVADPASVGEGPGHRVADTGRDLVVVAHAQAVDDDADLIGFRFGADSGQDILDEFRLSVDQYAHEALGEQQRQLFDDPLPGTEHQRCADDYTLPAVFEQVFGDVVRRVAADLFARDGREGVPDAGEEEFQVVVDFGRRADGRAGVAGIDLLFDGDGRSDSLDDVDIGFVDLAEELPGIGREALDIASLAFGEDGVEGQGRLSGSRQSGDDYQFFVRDLQLDVAEVVDPRTLYVDAVFVFFHIRKVRLLRSCSVR